jgi:hypothetical protein
MFRLSLKLLGPFTALLAASCAPPSGITGPCTPFQAGESPCRQQLYFPTGVAIDPDGDVLYVTNGNADLRYSGGSMMALDLRRFDCAIEYARQGFQGTVPGCDDIDYLTLPDRCLAENTPPQLSQSRTDHDGCRRNLLDPSIIECDECPYIASAVRIGNFPSQIAVQPRPTPVPPFPVVESKLQCPDGTSSCAPNQMVSVPDCPPGSVPLQGGTLTCTPTSNPGFNRRLWTAVRGDPSLTYVHAIKTPRTSTAPSTVTLNCGGDSRNQDGPLSTCDLQRIAQRDLHGDMRNAPVPTGSTLDTLRTLAPEPFGLGLSQCGQGLPYAPECPAGQTPFAHLGVTHLQTGQVTLINADAFSPSSIRSVSNPTERVVYDVRLAISVSSGPAGAFAIAPRTRGDRSSFWYVTSRASSSIASFVVSPTDDIGLTFGFGVSAGPFATGDDVRGVVFDQGGDRAFFLDNRPPAVFMVDTRIEPSTGLPRNQVIDIVPVCLGASHLDVRSFVDQGRTVTRVYVACFTAGQLLVIDADLATVIAVSNIGQGPFDLTFNFGPGMAEPARHRAYVSNYVDATISVVDLEPGSPTENRVIATIGIPSPPVTQ